VRGQFRAGTAAILLTRRPAPAAPRPQCQSADVIIVILLLLLLLLSMSIVDSPRRGQVQATSEILKIYLLYSRNTRNCTRSNPRRDEIFNNLLIVVVYVSIDLG